MWDLKINIYVNGYMRGHLGNFFVYRIYYHLFIDMTKYYAFKKVPSLTKRGNQVR